MARSVMDQIVGHGKVVRGYLGLFPQDVTPALARQFGLSKPGGALVSGLKPDAPAAKAGIRDGDVILELNGQPVESANDLRLAHFADGAGIEREARKFRATDKMQDVDVTLGELPPDKLAEETPGQRRAAAGSRA